MKKALIVLIALCAIGCNSISPEAMTEVEEATTIGQRVLDEWDGPNMTDERKRKFIFRFVRVGHNIQADVKGTPIPAEYQVAPVTSGS